MSDVNEEDLDAIENEPDPADESADEEASGDTGEESSGDTGEESSGDKGEDKDKEEPATNWRDAIKDEKLRKQAERYNTPEDAVKNILNLRQQLSKSITKPGKDSDEVEVASFRKQMGIPETPDGYHFPPPASEEENTEEFQASQEKWKGLLHENNVPKDAAESIVKAYREDVENMAKAEKKADDDYAKAGEDALREEWGGDFDKNKQFANSAAETLFGEDFEEVRALTDKSGRFILDNPVFVKGLSQIGREMGEGNLGQSTLNENQRDSLQEQADQYRAKAKEANRQGRTAEAQKWDAKEREVLGKLSGTQGLVGSEGRTF
jgi:hypothetical protein